MCGLEFKYRAFNMGGEAAEYLFGVAPNYLADD